MKKGSLFTSRRREAAGNVVTLFPFLAVLLCTMGALIMLLVVIAQSVRQPAVSVLPPIAEVILPEPMEEETKRPTEAEAKELLQRIEERRKDDEWFAGELRESVRKMNEKLVGERSQLAFLEQQTERFREELQQLLAAARGMEDSTTISVAEKEEQTKQLQRKQEELGRLEGELKRLQQEAIEAKKSYAIVPFRGKDGTYRRPLFIECRDEKVILQPEGIELEAMDFVAGDRPDNPLDAALRAARQYLIETRRLSPEAEPYPLLIVRPSGIEAYLVAKSSLGSWTGDFGYELMEEDAKVEYPPCDPVMKERMERQVILSRQRIAGLVAMLREESMQREIPQYRVGAGGRVERVGGGLGNGSERGTWTGSRMAGTNRPRGGPTLGGSGNVGGSRPGTTAAGGGRHNSGMEQRGAGVGEIPGATHAGSAVPFGSAYGAVPFGQSAANTSESIPENGNEKDEGDTETSSRPASDATNKTRTKEVAKNRSEGSAEGMAGTSSGAAGETGTTGKASPFGMSGQPMTSVMPQDGPLLPGSSQPTGVVRAIKVKCEPDSLIIEKQQGLLRAIRIGTESGHPAAVAELGRKVWEFTETWGIAGENMFWQPVLKVDVAPGAEALFEQLRLRLIGSGINVDKVSTR